MRRSRTRSKLDPYKTQLVRLMVKDGYSLDRCCTWLKEKHGVTATRELVRLWAAKHAIVRRTVQQDLDTIKDVVSAWFTDEQLQTTAGQACKQLQDEYGISVSAPTLEKWLSLNGLEPFRPRGYKDDLNALRDTLLNSVAEKKMSARETCAWLQKEHQLTVPITAFKQWLSRQGLAPGVFLARKRLSCLDAYKAPLTEMFQQPGIKIPDALVWLESSGGPKVSAQALVNWLQTNSLRPVAVRKGARDLGKKLEGCKALLLRKFSQDGFSVKDGLHWLSQNRQIEVGAQTLSAWLHKHGIRPKGRRGPAPKKPQVLR